MKIISFIFVCLLLTSCGMNSGQVMDERHISNFENEDDILLVSGDEALDKEISNDEIVFFAEEDTQFSRNPQESQMVLSNCLITEKREAIQRIDIAIRNYESQELIWTAKSKKTELTEEDLKEFIKLKDQVKKELIVSRIPVINQMGGGCAISEYVGPDEIALSNWFSKHGLASEDNPNNRFTKILTKDENGRDFFIIGTNQVITNTNLEYKVGQTAAAFAYQGESSKKFKILLNKYCPEFKNPDFNEVKIEARNEAKMILCIPPI